VQRLPRITGLRWVAAWRDRGWWFDPAGPGRHAPGRPRRRDDLRQPV